MKPWRMWAVLDVSGKYKQDLSDLHADKEQATAYLKRMERWARTALQEGRFRVVLVEIRPIYRRTKP